MVGPLPSSTWSEILYHSGQLCILGLIGDDRAMCWCALSPLHNDASYTWIRPGNQWQAGARHPHLPNHEPLTLRTIFLILCKASKTTMSMFWRKVTHLMMMTHQSQILSHWVCSNWLIAQKNPLMSIMMHSDSCRQDRNSHWRSQWPYSTIPQYYTQHPATCCQHKCKQQPGQWGRLWIRRWWWQWWWLWQEWRRDEWLSRTWTNSALRHSQWCSFRYGCRWLPQGWSSYPRDSGSDEEYGLSHGEWHSDKFWTLFTKIGHKQTQLDHVRSVTEKLKAILPHYSVFVKFSELRIHLYM